MDTVRLRFPYSLDKIAPEYRELYFSEQIAQRKVSKMFPSKSSRVVYTSNSWRKEQQAKGIYMPKYSIDPGFRDPDKTSFVLELSLPKFIYGTNAIPLKNTDRDIVIDKIQGFCKSIGVNLFHKQIRDTVPTAVAFGENIDITNVATAEQAVMILANFNDRFRSGWYLHRFPEGGSELYFNTQTSTFKVYDKLAEVKNHAITQVEHGLVRANQAIGSNGKIWIGQIIRAELSLRTVTALRRKVEPYIKREPTLGNLFSDSLWHIVITKEVEQVFVHPLADFVFLSTLQAEVIQTLLRLYVKKHQTRLWIKDLVEVLQRGGGTKGVREHYNETFSSRQTYHNHLKTAREIQAKLDPKLTENLTSRRFHHFFLEHFSIKTKSDNTLF